MAIAVAAFALLVTPAVAAAHGPVAPVATSYRAEIRTLPAGLQAKIVDGYVRIWLRVPASDTLVVLDYRGAPYLRFTRAGVQVNANSEMAYLNQLPYALAVPPGLTRTTPPRWQAVSAGHDYEWHDGRLQALASIALAPGASYVGRWSVPIELNGRRTAIAGGLWHAESPSILWFWPFVVLLVCWLAAWRVRSPALDRRVMQILGIAALVALSLACVGRELHGRPNVSAFQYIELALVIAFAVWELSRVLLGRASVFAYAVIAIVAFWQGIDLLPTLVNGYVLIALPGAVARMATVACLGCAACLGLFALREDDELRSRRRRRRRNKQNRDRARGAHGV
jgi:hypothetical protein